MRKGSSGEMPYPSIRNLPLLGVKYADYYRRAKIQETVFELLTQQYELAKVQEAKEIPSVKVLDPAMVPEKKSFPPRLLIVVMGTLLALAACAIWVFAVMFWQDFDPGDPRRVLAGRCCVFKSRATALSRSKADAGAGPIGKSG